MTHHKFFLKGTKGQGLVEYALILMLVATASIVAISVFGAQVQTMFCRVSVEIGDRTTRVCTTGVAPNARVPDSFPVEAIVNSAARGNVDRVRFSIDNGYVSGWDHSAPYCMTSSGGACDPYTFSGLSAGSHTLQVIIRPVTGADITINIPFTR